MNLKHVPALFLLLCTFLIRPVLSTLLPQELKSYETESGVIQVNKDNFDQLLQGNHEYYMAVLYTSNDPEINCAICQKFDKVFHKISKSYHESNPEKDAIFFYNVEFTENKDQFIKMQMTQVPRLWLIPPNKDLNANLTHSPHYPYQISDNSIEDQLHFANFISKIVNVNIIVKDDFEITQFLMYFVGTFVTVLLLKKKVLAKLPKQYIFRLGSVLAVIVFTSGYMFTVIRGIPFIAKNEQGEVMQFSGGTHWQFGLETFIISGFYLMFVVFINALVYKIPKVQDTNKRSILVILVSLSIFWLFNSFTKIFLIKDPGYPYQLTNYL